ncbi:Arylsulfatase [Diaporthe amygdali]|uniref:Arylsulfatase n=1 Tax=Phomopsis amygdali TaxID=1214568 RepID=UPI0022FDE541|nr:Arylsulfatase [Diaporthe amygdali]KAJ0108684.1 Arylsulfatase [Diaporthe amygdali]
MKVQKSNFPDLDEYGFLKTPEFVPRLGDELGKEVEERDDIWRRLFHRGLRGADQAKYYDDAVVRSALKWLESPPEDKPWVPCMPLIFPHCPFQVEEPDFSMYDREDMPPPSSKDDKTGYEPQYMATNCERCGTDSATRELGCVVARTKERGHWDSTVAMFFTDNGEYLGEHFPVLRAALFEFAFSEGCFLLSEGPLLEQALYPYDIEPALQHEDTALVGKAVSIRDKE